MSNRRYASFYNANSFLFYNLEQNILQPRHTFTSKFLVFQTLVLNIKSMLQGCHNKLAFIVKDAIYIYITIHTCMSLQINIDVMC